MKTILIIINLFVLIAVIHLAFPQVEKFLFKSAKEILTEKLNYHDNFYQLSDIDNVQSAIWLNSQEIVLQTENEVVRFDITERKTKRTYAITRSLPNIMISSSKGKIIMCEWENYVKQSPNDYGTIIRITDIQSGDINNSVSLFPTVKIADCRNNILKLSSAYDFLEYKRYIYDLERKTLNDDNGSDNTVPKYNVGGNMTTVITYKSKVVKEIKKTNIFNHVEVYDLDRILLFDNSGNVWVYFTSP